MHQKWSNMFKKKKNSKNDKFYDNLLMPYNVRISVALIVFPITI